MRESIEKYVEQVKNVIREDHDAKQYFHGFEVTVEYGRKYAKVIVDRAAHSFVDMETGDIYKPAGWNGRAKHVRGSILSETNGKEALEASGCVRYL